MESSERVERFPVWRRCEATRFVLRELYWLNLDLTSLSMPAISCPLVYQLLCSL